MRESLRAVALVAAAALLSACGGSGAASGTDEPGQLTGTRLDPPFDLAATPLRTTDGAPYSLVDDTDRPLTLVFFGYTNCPDICGQVMSTLAGTMTRLSDADRADVDVAFVTTDPERDTPEVVSDYVAQFDEDFIGVTGEIDDIIAVGRTVGVGIESGDELDHDGDGKPDGYDVTHGTQVLAVDGTDTVPVYWSQEVSQAQLATDIHTLLSED